jgi:hypothetical protein
MKSVVATNADSVTVWQMRMAAIITERLNRNGAVNFTPSTRTPHPRF